MLLATCLSLQYAALKGGYNAISCILSCQIVTMQPSATVSHQIVHYSYPEEQFHTFSTIGEEELYKLVKSAKPTTCMLDPIPSKLLKEVLPEVIDPLLAIINLSLGYVPKNFKLAVIKPLIKKPQLDPKDLVNPNGTAVSPAIPTRFF